MWVGLALAAVVGVALLIGGLRGRRVDDHPLCRRCGFDLTGRPAGSTVCGECGADLSSPPAVRVGHRARRGGLLATGVAVLVPAVSVAGVLGWRAVGRVGWLHYAPVKVLLWRTASDDASVSSPALAELATRGANRLLSDRQWAAVADAALTAQADAARPWDTRWGDLIEDAQAAGHLSADRWQRYARAAWANVFSVQVRPIVRRGDPIPFAIQLHAGRVAAWSVLRVRISDVRLVWPGLPAERLTAPPMVVDLVGATSTVTPQSFAFPAGRLADGVQPVRLTAAVEVGPSEDPEEEDHVRQVVATGRLDLPATTTIVGTARPAGQVATDPGWADAVRRSLRVDPPPRPAAAGRGSGTAMVWVTRPPVGLSFDVSVRVAGRPDLPVGQVVCPAATTSGHGMELWPDLPPGTPYDVMFRADPALAASTIDVTQAWDGDVVLHAVAP